MPLPEGYIWAQVNWSNLVPLLPTRCLYQGRDGVHPQFRSTRLNLVPLLITRCHYWGGTSDQRSYLRADQISNWPDVVPLLATRCLYQGIHLSSHPLDPTEYNSWPLDASTGGVEGVCPQTHIHYTDFISHALLGSTQLKLKTPLTSINHLNLYSKGTELLV